MTNFKKFSLALLLAVAAFFTAEAKFERVKEISVPKGAKELKQDSDDIFSWQEHKGTRYLVYRGKLQDGKETKYVPMTVYTVTVPYDVTSVAFSTETVHPDAKVAITGTSAVAVGKTTRTLTVTVMLFNVFNLCIFTDVESMNAVVFTLVVTTSKLQRFWVSPVH